MKRSQRLFGSRFSPLIEWRHPPQTGHGRIDLRHIDLLPVDAVTEHMRALWPSVRSSARITRRRAHVRSGNIVKSETETTRLISSLSQPDPKHILHLNRHHWRIEAMHRDKDVTLGKDGYTNRSGNAPRNIFVLTSAARTNIQITHQSNRNGPGQPRNSAPCQCRETKNVLSLKRPDGTAGDPAKSSQEMFKIVV